MGLLEVSIAILTVVIFTVPLLLIGFRLYTQQTKWIPADAVVLKFTPRADSAKNTLVEYTVNGNVNQRKCRFLRGAFNPLLEGQAVQILHHPYKPHKIATPNPLNLFKAYVIFIMVVATVVIAIVALLHQLISGV